MKAKFLTRKKLVFLAFVLPGALYMTVMILLPIGYNIVISFKDVNLMNFARGGSIFVGLDTFQEVFSEKLLYTAIWNTLVFTFYCLLFQFPIGLLLAMFFARKFTGAGVLRGINVIGWMIPMVAVAGIFKYMFNSDIGIVNRALAWLGIIHQPVEWLAYGNSAMAAVVIANIWKGVPFNMILLATALTTLPTDVYESASIDGANSFQRFFYITLPLLKPAMVSVLTLGFIYTFKVFDLVYVLTGGGPGSTTEMLSTLAYRYSFTEYNFSRGAAVANVLFVLLMLVGSVYIRITNRETEKA